MAIRRWDAQELGHVVRGRRGFNWWVQEQKLLELKPFHLEVQMEGAPRCTSELVHDDN